MQYTDKQCRELIAERNRLTDMNIRITEAEGEHLGKLAINHRKLAAALEERIGPVGDEDVLKRIGRSLADLMHDVPALLRERDELRERVGELEMAIKIALAWHDDPTGLPNPETDLFNALGET